MGWGESSGRRFYFNPTELAEDIKTVTSYVRTLDIADTGNTFNAGICMGAAFASYATGFDSRVKALAVVSPYVDAAQSYVELAGGSTGALRSTMLAQVAQAKAHRFATGQDVYVKIVPGTKQNMTPRQPMSRAEWLTTICPATPALCRTGTTRWPQPVLIR
ncbi:MAG: hypothetical protein R3E95_19510 [Thiolinea sp.]